MISFLRSFEIAITVTSFFLVIHETEYNVGDAYNQVTGGMFSYSLTLHELLSKSKYNPTFIPFLWHFHAFFSIVMLQ